MAYIAHLISEMLPHIPPGSPSLEVNAVWNTPGVIRESGYNRQEVVEDLMYSAHSTTVSYQLIIFSPLSWTSDELELSSLTPKKCSPKLRFITCAVVSALTCCLPSVLELNSAPMEGSESESSCREAARWLTVVTFASAVWQAVRSTHFNTNFQSLSSLSVSVFIWFLSRTRAVTSTLGGFKWPQNVCLSQIFSAALGVKSIRNMDNMWNWYTVDLHDSDDLIELCTLIFFFWGGGEEKFRPSHVPVENISSLGLMSTHKFKFCVSCTKGSSACVNSKNVSVQWGRGRRKHEMTREMLQRRFCWRVFTKGFTLGCWGTWCGSKGSGALEHWAPLSTDQLINTDCIHPHTHFSQFPTDWYSPQNWPPLIGEDTFPNTSNSKGWMHRLPDISQSKRDGTMCSRSRTFITSTDVQLEG